MSEPGTLRHVHARIDAVHEEFKRCQREGLRPPTWEELDELVVPGPAGDRASTH